MKKFNLTKTVAPAFLLSLSAPAHAALEIYGCDGHVGNYIEMSASSYDSEPSDRTMIFFRELAVDGRTYANAGDEAGTAYGYGAITEDSMDMALKFTRTGSRDAEMIGRLQGKRIDGQWRFTITKTDSSGNATKRPVTLNPCKVIDVVGGR